MRRTVTMLLLGGTMLSGCTTMGGNVKGSFSCVAPEGICAPSSVIDDRALALIAGEDGDRVIQPAGPYPAPQREGRAFTVAANGAARTGEKVLRIVFPSHIDAAGRLHEQTAVHAVVDAGDWRPTAPGQVVAANSAPIAEVAGGATLLAALDAAETAMPEPGAIDRDMPSAAAIDAARVNRATRPARAASADPIGAIKREVAATLTPSPRPLVRTPATSTTRQASAPAAARITTPALPTRTPQGSPTAGTIIPAQATSEGRQAVAAIGMNPVIQSAAAQVERDARGAKPAPTVRAPAFPGIDGAER